MIFRVHDVDAYHERLTKAELFLDQPTDAPWGERYFHITDPDGHELSFAQLIARSLTTTSSGVLIVGATVVGDGRKGLHG